MSVLLLMTLHCRIGYCDVSIGQWIMTPLIMR